MKKFKIVLIIFGSLIVLGIVALAVFIKSFNLDQFKDKITAQIGKDLNRQVALKSVKFSLAKGLSLNLSGLTIQDSPEFSDDNFLDVPVIRLHVDVARFVSNREIVVSSVDIDSPKVRLIRNSKGVLNVPAPAKPAAAQTAALFNFFRSQGFWVKDANASANDTQAILEKLQVNAVRIHDAQISFRDESSTPAITIPITNLEFVLKQFKANQWSPFESTARLWSQEDNIKINGEFFLNAQDLSVQMKDGKANVALSKISPALMAQDIPTLAPVGLNRIQGEFNTVLSQLSASATGLTDLAAEGQLVDGSLEFNQGLPKVDNIDAAFNMDENVLNFTQGTCEIGSGKIEITGILNDYMKQPKYSFKMNVIDLPIADLLAKQPMPVVVEGKLVGQFEGKGEGFDFASAENPLIGTGGMELKEGKLVDLNLLQLVLSRLSSFIPDLQSRLESQLPEKYKEILSRKDTIITGAKMGLMLRQGIIELNGANLSADGFNITAAGKMDLKQNTIFSPAFFISQDLSTALVAAASEFSFLLNENQQVNIPIQSYEGPLSSIRIFPDLEALGKQAIQGRGKDELKNAIFKALDLDDKPAQPAEGNAPGTQPSTSGETPPKETSPEKQLIEGLLNSILK